MRSCIYCGKELEKGEVCICPQSVARRTKTDDTTQSNANTDSEKENYSNPYRTESSYKTGYSGAESRFKRFKNKCKAKRASKRSSTKTTPKTFFGELWRYILQFIKSPVDTISNPPHLSKSKIIILAALQGIVLWLCTFFIIRGGGVGPLKILTSLMGAGSGYSLIGQLILCIISGAINGIVLFILYSGTFYLISRFIMKLKTPYWEFSVRLASTWIPFTVICFAGVILSMLSPITLLVMLLCGAVSVAVLTYEALKTEWISKSPCQVLYAMMLGYFIFFSIVCYLIII